MIMVVVAVVIPTETVYPTPIKVSSKSSTRSRRWKSRQKVEELSKSPKNLKGLKSCKGHWFRGTFTEAPILRWRTWASVRALTVFRALFAGTRRSSFDTTFESIIDKTQLMKQCSVTFFPSRAKKIFEINTQILHYRQSAPASVSSTSSLSLTPLHQVFICVAHVFPPLL